MTTQPMPTNPYDPMANESTDHTPKAANNLTLEELNQQKDGAARAISAILNRFSDQTGLRVESIELDIAFIYGQQNRYYAKLDVRL